MCGNSLKELQIQFNIFIVLTEIFYHAVPMNKCVWFKQQKIILHEQIFNHVKIIFVLESVNIHPTSQESADQMTICYRPLKNVKHFQHHKHWWLIL